MTGPYEPNRPHEPSQSPPPWERGPAVPPPTSSFGGAVPPQRYGPPPGPPAAPKRNWVVRHKVLTAVLTVVGLFFLLGGIGAAMGGGADGKSVAATTGTPVVTPVPPASAPSAPTAAPMTADGIQDTTPPPPEVDYTATAKDFTITLKIKSKACFGDAGCNVTYEPKLTVVGPNVDETGSYEITYEVRGGENGASVDTIEVDDGQYSAGVGLASTARQSSRLTAVVTEVETN